MNTPSPSLRPLFPILGLLVAVWLGAAALLAVELL